MPTRGNLLPDPVQDEVRCLFYVIEHRSPATQTKGATLLPQNDCGCIIVKDIESENAGQDHHMYGTGGNNEVTMRFVNTEIEALEALVELSMRWDPDIYGGYEIETASWGYVLERGKHLGFNIAPLLSRVPTQKVREFVDEDREHFTDLDIEVSANVMFKCLRWYICSFIVVEIVRAHTLGCVAFNAFGNRAHLIHFRKCHVSYFA